MTTSTTLTILLYLTLAFLRASAQCYNPDGTPASSQYQPCSSDRPSMCCALNRTSSLVNSCRSDNLCADVDNNTLWRESCTDQTWENPACLKLCVEGHAQGLIGSINIHTRDSPLTTCSDGSICCGLIADVCCTGRNGFWLVNGTVYPYADRPTGISLTAPTTTASFIPSLNRDGSASTPSAPINSGTISISTLRLGLGVGLGVGIPILLAIIAVLMSNRVDELPVNNLTMRELDSNSKELNFNQNLRELDSNLAPRELDSNPVSAKPN